MSDTDRQAAMRQGGSQGDAPSPSMAGRIPTLQATRTEIQPERAELSKPSFTNKFKQASSNKNNDLTGRNGQDTVRRGSGSLSGRVAHAQASQGFNSRETKETPGLGSSPNSRSSDGLGGFEKRVERLKQYEENVNVRAQRGEDVFRAVPGLRGDNYLQTATRYGLSLPGRLATELPERANIVLQKGYASTEGLLRSESRKSTISELGGAVKRTPSATAQTLDPRDPRGGVNILTVGLGVRSFAKSNPVTLTSSPKPQVATSSTPPGVPTKATYRDPILNTPKSELNAFQAVKDSKINVKATEAAIDALFKETGGKAKPKAPTVTSESTYVSAVGRKGVGLRKRVTATVRQEAPKVKDPTDIGLRRDSLRTNFDELTLRAQRAQRKLNQPQYEGLRNFDVTRGSDLMRASKPKEFVSSKVDAVYPLKLENVAKTKKIFFDIDGKKTFKTVSYFEKELVPDYTKPPVYVSKQTGKPVSKTVVDKLLEQGKKETYRSTKKSSSNSKEYEANVQNFFTGVGFDKRGTLNYVLKRPTVSSRPTALSRSSGSPRPSRGSSSFVDEPFSSRAGQRVYAEVSKRMRFDRSGASGLGVVLVGATASAKRSKQINGVTYVTNRKQDEDVNRITDQGGTGKGGETRGGNVLLTSSATYVTYKKFVTPPPTPDGFFTPQPTPRIDDPPFFKFPRPPEGGGGGGGRRGGGGGSRKDKYAPSLTGIELGVKQKRKSSSGFSGLEVRGL